MNQKSKLGTLLVTLGFILSVLAVFAPAGAAGGRAENFVVTVTFTNADGSHDNSSNWKDTDMINITANVTIAGAMENVTDLMLELTINGNLEGAPLSLGGLNATEFKEYTWQSNPPGYGDYTVMVTAVNGTDNANQTVKTLYYRSLDSDISITGVTATPAAALVGVDEVTMTAALANAGNEMGKANVTFAIGVITIGFVEQDVPAGGTADVVLKTKFEGLSPPDGKYSVKASMKDLQSSEATSAENITLNNPMTDVKVESLAVTPTSGIEGTMVNFTVSLSNSGTINATNVIIMFQKTMGMFQPVMLGNLSGLTVLKGATGVNFTWAYTLPNITPAQETQTIRAGYFDGQVLANYKSTDVTIVKKTPEITFVSFVIPAGIRQYDAVVMNVTIKNTGSADAVNMTMKLKEAGMTFCTTVPFNLAVGAQKTVPMEITIMSEGGVNQSFIATASAGGKDFSNTTTVFVGIQIYPAIGISALKITPAKKENQPKDSSQSYSAAVTLKNSGQKAGKVQLTLVDSVSKKIVANQSFSVGANASSDVKVSFSVKGAGTHSIVAFITGDIESFGNSTKTAKCELQYQPGFEVVVLISAILVAVVIIRRRKD
jgi:hypothetical protein